MHHGGDSGKINTTDKLTKKQFSVLKKREKQLAEVKRC